MMKNVTRRRCSWTNNELQRSSDQNTRRGGRSVQRDGACDLSPGRPMGVSCCSQKKKPRWREEIGCCWALTSRHLGVAVRTSLLRTWLFLQLSSALSLAAQIPATDPSPPLYHRFVFGVGSGGAAVGGHGRSGPHHGLRRRAVPALRQRCARARPRIPHRLQQHGR